MTVRKVSEAARARNTEWHRENRERLSHVRAARAKNNPEGVARIGRNTALKINYGITLDDYLMLFNKQEGKCAICLRLQPKTLHVDHCHSSKKVRGLLCQRCNMGIGFLDDNTERLKMAVKYLNKKGKVL